MMVSRSSTMHPQSTLLTIGGTVLKESDDLVILWVTFDSKMTFERHLRTVSIAASQRLGILRKSWRVFHDSSLLLRCFRGFVLPVLEYCSAVWCSAADTHLKLLHRAVNGARFLTGGVFECGSFSRSGSFSTVPPIVNGGDWECIVRDLETIIVLVLLAFSFIPQRSHHLLTLPRSRIRDSVTATLTPGDGTAAIKV